MHSSKMRTIRCSGCLGGGFARGGVSAWGVSAQIGCMPKGCLPGGEGCLPAMGCTFCPPCGQNSWHTLVKTLPFLNYCRGRQKLTRKPVGFMQSCCHWRTTCHLHPIRMTCHLHPFRMMCHPHPFWMTCHLHPFRMTCHLHCKETGLTSLKSQKQLTGQPDN